MSVYFTTMKEINKVLGIYTALNTLIRIKSDCTEVPTQRILLVHVIGPIKIPNAQGQGESAVP